ncbi:MAG: efflux RND transporter periplasmic adaptor subunit, partial [Rhodanobacteraceae bacterium]
MSDGTNNDLLHELRIDHGKSDDHESRPRWPWIVAVAILVLIIVAGGATFALRGRAVTVQTSTAVAASSGNDAAVLQATGYVVARRQANVSAQII